MKKLFYTFALLMISYYSANAQAKRTINTTPVVAADLSNAKQATPEGHYCDYCKENKEASHFPCIMKAIKGKIDGAGRVSFTAGQPIGGIVVKGGKNPGGNFNVITNENGEFEFDNDAVGAYTIVVSLPTNDPTSRVEGNPIGGIIVKGGKNPGGNFITLITNEKGELMLANLSPGHYKFVMTGAFLAERTNPLYQSIATEGVNPLHKEN